MINDNRHVHIFFMDGVGLGEADPEINPFATAVTPHLSSLLNNPIWYLNSHKKIITQRASLIATDANLDMPRRPQSATGQATILTGRNVPQLVGEHYGPKPNKAVAEIIRAGSLFQEVVDAGGTAALLTPYPQPYFDAIKSGRRLFSAVPLAATSAGIELMTTDDLVNGRSVSPGFTGQAWHNHLGIPNIPILSLQEAGQQIATLAQQYHFSFFEHWPSDRSGHRGTLENAVKHVELLDSVIGSLVQAWDNEEGLLIITSDHGNLEAKNHRKHTRNPVPTILVGKDHAQYAQKIHDLTNIATIVREFLFDSTQT